jgi:hypothetical protein
MRVFNVMGNRRLYNTKCIHMLGTPESELLKVAALNLFHPTASPPFQRVGFFHIATQPLKGGIFILRACLPVGRDAL